MFALKKTALVCVLSAPLALGGCITASQLSDEVTRVQQQAVQVCKFLPDVTTVSAILSSFVQGAAPVNAVATQVAAQICAAVQPRAAASRSVPANASVNGVVIHGMFVK